MGDCIHRMNLRGPWFYEWIDGPEPADAFPERCADRDSPQMSTSRVRMPAGWLDAFGAVTGTVRLRRRFGCPTGLEPDERVQVTVDGFTGQGDLAVNGEKLGTLHDAGTPQSFDVTDRLQRSNTLEITLRHDPGVRDPAGADVPVVSCGIEIHAVGSTKSLPS